MRCSDQPNKLVYIEAQQQDVAFEVQSMERVPLGDIDQLPTLQNLLMAFDNPNTTYLHVA